VSCPCSGTSVPSHLCQAKLCAHTPPWCPGHGPRRMHAHPLCSRLHRPRRPPRAGGPVRPDACGDHPRPGGGHSARRLPHTRRAGPAALRLAAAPFHASWKCSTPGMPRFMSSSGSSVQATAALCPRLQTGSTDKGLDSQGSAHRCRQTCCCSPWTSTRAGAHPVLRNTPRRQAHAAALWAVLCALNPISLHMPDSALRQVRFGCACRHLPHYTGHRPQAARNIRLL